MSIQLTCPEGSPNADYSHSSSSISFIPYVSSAEKRTLQLAAIKVVENREKNKRSTSYEAFEILKKQVTTLSDSSMKKGYPHRIDGLFHPFIASKPRRPCQYCMRNERMLDPSAGKIGPGAKRKRTPGGNLVHPVQRLKINYNGAMLCIPCNVELCLLQ